MEDVKTYMKEQKHLPDFMRDFHDQKDLFKTLFDLYSPLPNEVSELNPVNTHVFTLDYFLWFMAVHGYKLQKIRSKKLPFRNIHATIKTYKQKSLNNLSKLISHEQNNRTSG